MSKKIIVILCFLISLSGCTRTETISIDDMEPEDIQVKLEITGGYELAKYDIFLSNENRVIAYDARKESKSATVLSVDNEGYLCMLKQCIKELQNCEKETVDFHTGFSDMYEIHMYINGNVYSFEYGNSRNPYANILTEIMLSYSDVEGLENVKSYISTIRKN